MANSPDTHTANPTGSRSRQRGAPAPEDVLLYPALIDHVRPAPRPGWWARLRQATADYLADPEIEACDRRWDATRAVHRYQRELGYRAHRATVARVEAGWWQGRAPYGYQLRRQRATDNAGRRGWRHRLIPDPVRARVVPVIFAWYVHDGLGDDAIAVRLAANPAAYPPPLDPVTGRPLRWTPARVRTILTQPAYLGYVIWGRTRHGQPQPEGRWYASDHATHPALITPDEFWAAYLHRYPDLPSSNDSDPTGPDNWDDDADWDDDGDWDEPGSVSDGAGPTGQHAARTPGATGSAHADDRDAR